MLLGDRQPQAGRVALGMTKQNRKIAVPAAVGTFEDAIEVAFREESAVATKAELFGVRQCGVREES